jgi:hypothetical protein
MDYPTHHISILPPSVVTSNNNNVSYQFLKAGKYARHYSEGKYWQGTRGERWSCWPHGTSLPAMGTLTLRHSNYGHFNLHIQFFFKWGMLFLVSYKTGTSEKRSVGPCSMNGNHFSRAQPFMRCKRPSMRVAARCPPKGHYHLHVSVVFVHLLGWIPLKEFFYWLY